MSGAPSGVRGRARRVLAAAWERFFAPQPQQAMVLVRIALGAIALLSCAVKLPEVDRLFGPEGLGGAAWAAGQADESVGALRALLRLPLEAASPRLTRLLFGAMMAAALAFALGAWTRTSGVALLLLHAIFLERNPFAFAGSWPWMYKAFLLYAILAPSGRWLSVDARRRRAHSGPAPPGDWRGPAIPVRLLQMHVCTLYAAAGWARLPDPGWQRGEMVFAALTDDWFGRYDLDWYPWLGALRILSYFAFAAEPLAPFALWLPGVGRWWALALMAMHAALELLTNLGWWQFQMIAVLTVFLPPRWLSPLLGGARAPRPPT